jgi:prepilin-type N-terminal cleavage/methylation domain-containing protein
MSCSQKTQSGLTLIETLTALTIFSLSLGAVFTFILQGMKAQNMNSKQLIAQSNGRYALKNLVTELRGVQYSEEGTYPIEKAEDNVLIFYSDIDFDGRIEKMRYFIENSELKRGVTKPSGEPPKYPPTSEKITSAVKFLAMGGEPIFKYYEGSYTGTESPLPSPFNLGKIRLIHIKIIIGVNPNETPPPLSLETQAVLRNLKDNL